MDGSGNSGVIYMSFGSLFQAKYMSSDKRKTVLEVLRSLAPIRVIWKWEGDEVNNDKGRKYI